MLIFTEGDTLDELRKNVLKATSAFIFHRPRTDRVHLRYPLAVTDVRLAPDWAS
jgi:hypothetical protein